MVADARDIDQERSATVADTLTTDAMHDEFYYGPASSWTDLVDRVLAALGLDPATPLDGPVVVLHPALSADLREMAELLADCGHGEHADRLDAFANPQERTP